MYKYMISLSFYRMSEPEYYFEYGNNANQALANLLEYISIESCESISIKLIKNL